MVALNRFELTARQFIDLCGEGEWFVGSRGGAGDHSAIYLGQRGKIINVGFLPFKVKKVLNAPQDYQVVIANSHIISAKSSESKHTFNQKICSYNLGLELLKHRHPELAHRIECLRDVNPENLNCKTSDIYKLLLQVPQNATREDFLNILPNRFKDMLEINFASHRTPKYYNVRGVLLFGIAEIMRSMMCPDYLENQKLEDFGQMMKISHDGDRISRQTKTGSYLMTKDSCSDAYLNRCIEDLAGENPQKVLQAQLYLQPGSYRCSTREIDQFVDIALQTPGVIGAQIAGAGLGGCIMAMVKKDSVNALKKALHKNYYEPRNLKTAFFPCITVEGAGLIQF